VGSRSTPSRQHRARGINTLIGNGWLRESPRARPGIFDLRSRSAMRKCVLLEVPPEVRALGPIVTPALPPPPRRSEPPIETRRSDPGKYVREMPAFPLARPRRDVEQNVAPAHGHAEPAQPGFWDDPIVIGSLLILLPPVGLAALWTSKRYSNDARWALTVVTALMLCLATAAVIAVAALAR
jgi:hypothetical protein